MKSGEKEHACSSRDQSKKKKYENKNGHLKNYAIIFVIRDYHES